MNDDKENFFKDLGGCYICNKQILLPIGKDENGFSIPCSAEKVKIAEY